MRLDNLPLANSLASAKGWDNSVRAIMLASKALPVLPEDQRTDATRVNGCESNVWLAQQHDDSARFLAYSDSKIIRGVLAIILERVHTLPVQSRADFDYAQFLSECGLERYLSQSRNNGIAFVLKRLKTLALPVS